MYLYGLPVLYAIFVWWFSTGLIIYLDGLPRHTFRWSMLGATLLLAGSLWGLAASSADTSVAGAYCGFTAGLLAWGWLEISFYLGVVTGPRRQACPEGCSGWRHFGHAIQVSLYHEIAIFVLAGTVVAVTWGAPNQVGTWTFVFLWWMHQSARLNVFLGVRNLNEEFLPDHLEFLKSFFTRKPMNLLFPVSITFSTVVATILIQRATATGVTAFDATGYSFVATVMIVAILEHWFLMLPLPFAALWRWGLRSHVKRQPADVDLVTGFLGAGKTTFLLRTLAGADPRVRTAVLVNDFNPLGIDVSVLRSRGADVVEFPNGCICCSLREDLSRQLAEVVERWAPQRILIEPSGVANIAELLRSLDQPALRPLVRSRHVYGVIDAASFLSDYARMPEYFETRAGITPVMILNKTDLAPPAELRVAETTLRALNPAGLILPAIYGRIAADALATIPDTAARPANLPDATVPAHDAALGLTSWSTHLGGTCDPQGLHDLLDAVAQGRFGDVERVKGIARAGAGWVHFDVAGGRPNMAAFAPPDGERPRVAAIGRAVDEVRLQAAFDACAVPAAI